MGDLVWGRYSGCAAWPGIIVDPACIDAAKEQLKNPTKKSQGGKVWIMWYGEK